MSRFSKPVTLISTLIALSMIFMFQSAQSEEVDPWDHPRDVEINQQISDADLDRVLAPIALYPDTLLSHILVASTYPLELVQLARWRAANDGLSEAEASAAVEDRDWDPSVKALAPFGDLLQTLTADLDWLETLGNAFLQDEERVLAAVQGLRRHAYDSGNLSDNDYVDVEEEDDDIVIQPVRTEVIYVPYYDTRVVYGHWWHAHEPYYWHQPSHYFWNDGFYWSSNFFISAGFYFSSFHWHHRHLLVDYSWRYYHRNYPYHTRHSQVSKRHFEHWRHDPGHRHNVRYPKVNSDRHFIGKPNHQSTFSKGTSRSGDYYRRDDESRFSPRQDKPRERHTYNKRYTRPQGEQFRNRQVDRDRFSRHSFDGGQQSRPQHGDASRIDRGAQQNNRVNAQRHSYRQAPPARQHNSPGIDHAQPDRKFNHPSQQKIPGRFAQPSQRQSQSKSDGKQRSSSERRSVKDSDQRPGRGGFH